MEHPAETVISAIALAVAFIELRLKIKREVDNINERQDIRIDAIHNDVNRIIGMQSQISQEIKYRDELITEKQNANLALLNQNIKQVNRDVSDIKNYLSKITETVNINPYHNRGGD